jgi:hypothetical protein
MTTRNLRCRECGVQGDFYFKTVQANGGYGPRLLPLGWFNRGAFELRVCGNCGLTDWFVRGDNLVKVREKFSPTREVLGLEGP